MKRRALLSTVAAAAVAGCLGDGGGSGTTTGTETTGRTDEPTTRATTRETTASATPPALSDLGVPVGQVDSPFEADDGVERVVWHPGEADEPLALTPAADELSLPTDGTTFALANDTDVDFSLNFYDWGLHRRVDDEWFYLTPQEVPQPLHVLSAGETHEWAFTVDNTLEPSHGRAGETEATVAGLGGGEYAFAVSGWFESGDHEHRVGLGAAFALDGDPLELAVPGDFSTERDGDRVTATVDGQAGSTAEVLVVERVGDAGVPDDQSVQRYVAEQLVRPFVGARRPWLGEALALFEDGVATVRVETAAAFENLRFDREDVHYFDYRGDVYEARVETED
ncbi:hypothetical protein [Halobacterium yunchengense]|uniref:hypothetical protein n=1 Tax=Halobacterium yunchengense TaxID=3108497 RepID=UPI0030099BA0